jgi:hypothetical protein
MIFDFSIDYHNFRIRKYDDGFRLFSIYSNQKKKAKKIEKIESIEFFSNDLDNIELYLNKYFMWKKKDIVREVFDGIKY